MFGCWSAYAFICASTSFDLSFPGVNVLLLISDLITLYPIFIASTNCELEIYFAFFTGCPSSPFSSVILIGLFLKQLNGLSYSLNRGSIFHLLAIRESYSQNSAE